VKRFKAVAVAALTAGLALVPVVVAGPASAGGGPRAAALQTCQTTFHARPTSSGWVSDPCAAEDVADPYTTRAVRVQHYWSMSGGAHITDIRGTYTICNRTPASIARVSADAVALHRDDGVEYASSIQPQQVSSGCATMITVSKSVRGCGATDSPIGSQAYTSYTEARGSARTTDGLLLRVPTGGYDTTPNSYYRTVAAGAAC